jgi:hypothetical protein
MYINLYSKQQLVLTNFPVLLAVDNVGDGTSQLNAQPRIYKFDRPLQVDFTRSNIQFGAQGNLDEINRVLPITFFYCSDTYADMVEKVRMAGIARAVLASQDRTLAGIIRQLPDCPV